MADTDLGAFLLLDDKVHVVAGDKNSTTAAAVSLRGYGIVDVTLDIADPSEPLPVATVRIHHHDPDTTLLDSRVVGAEGPLLLITTRFRSGRELFLFDYRHGPQLLAIPTPPSDLKHVKCFVILPHGRGGQGKGFLLAAIDYVGNSFDQRVIVFSSEDGCWATKPLANPPWSASSFDKIKPDKAIAVGEKHALWADLDQGGMLLSDFSSDPPVFKYFLAPSGGVDPKIERLMRPTFSLRLCRNVSFANGFIKFVHIENTVVFTYPPQHTMEVLSVKDSDLISTKKRSCPEPDMVCNVNGRKIVIWSRTTTADAWSNRLFLDVDDFDFIDQSFTSQKTHCNLPTIGIDGDTVYFRGVREFGDDTGYLISADMRNKELKALGYPHRTTSKTHL